MKIFIILIVIGLIALGVLLYFFKRHPISEHCAVIPPIADTFLKIEAINPGDAGYYNNKGVDLWGPPDKDTEYWEFKNYDEALAAFDKAIELDPNNAIIYNNKGQVLLLLNRCKEAIKFFNTGLGINQNNAAIYTLLGLAYFCIHEYDKAIESYNKSISINKMQTEAYENKANTLDYIGKAEEALALYNELLDTNQEKDVVTIFINKSITLRKLGRHKEAKIALALFNKNNLELEPQAEIDTVDSNDSLKYFSDSFYLAHYKDLVTSSIHFMDESLIEDSVQGLPIPTFYSEVFKRYPEDVHAWILEIDRVKNFNFKQLLWSALWFSGNADGRLYLENMIESLPINEKEKLQDIISTRPPNLKKLTPRSPPENDMVWGAFFASGNTLYIINLINTATLFYNSNDFTEFTASGTAIWSLASGAQRHAIILDTLLAEYDNHYGTEKGNIIYEIIEKSTDPNGPELIGNEMEKIIQLKTKKGEWKPCF